MPGGYGQGLPDFVWLPHWEYLGGQVITADGLSQAATLPGGTQIFEIDAEGGDAHYEINSGFCNQPGSGYVPLNGARIEGPLSNLNSLHVCADAGNIVHIKYYREHVNRT